MSVPILKTVCVPILIATLLAQAAFAAAVDPAEPEDEEDHHPRLLVQPDLTLAAVLEQTLQRHPKTGTIAARRAQTQAWENYGRSWFSGTPMLGLRYQTDRFDDNDGLEEWESGLELPLWRWGQRARVNDYRDDLGNLSAASEAGLRWELAGELRRLLWNIGLAESRSLLAEQQLAAAESLLTLVQRQVNSGERPRSELLLAQTRQLEARSAALSAEAGLIDEEWRYQSLTGMTIRPALTPEQQSLLAQVPADHPLLALANARIAEAKAHGRVAADAAISSPTLTLGPRREKAVADSSFDDSIGLTLRVPIGSSRYQAVPISAAELAAAEARSERDQQLRLLQLDFHDAHHELAVTRNQLKLARESLEFTSQQVRMARIGYEQGEYNLIDLLREQRRQQAATSAVKQLELTENLLIAMYNQAVGVLP